MEQGSGYRRRETKEAPHARSNSGLYEEPGKVIDRRDEKAGRKNICSQVKKERKKEKRKKERKEGRREGRKEGRSKGEERREGKRWSFLRFVSKLPERDPEATAFEKN
ncbi:hypothetical protein E2C01_048114 [Portunus trituberculatus]|uniref:Uncharacterized protein n=1 Tax=Portunus trituberculatus TaxID=210409 RepID=A0A5B7G9P5_PORTR|nr:hypothetical protein [Portunus trituberculatus]